MPDRAGRILRALSFVSFFTTLLLYSPNVMALRGADEANLTAYFAEPLLLLATLCCAVLVTLSLVRPGLAAPRVLLPAAFALYLSGAAVFSLCVLLQPTAAGPVLCVAAAVAQAVSVVPVCLAWGRCLSDLDLVRALGLMALTVSLSAACNEALKAFGAPVAQLAFPLLTLAGLLWPAAALLRRRNDAGQVRASSSQAPARPSMRAFLSVMGVPLLGMAISSFAMGVQPGTLFDDAVDAQHLGMLLGALCVVPLALGHPARPLRPKVPLFSFAYQLYLPAFAAIALVLCAFPADSSVRECGLAAAYVLYAMVSVVGVAASVAVANTGEFPRALTISALVGLFSATGILGVFLGARIDDLIDNRSAVLVVLTALYGCWLMLQGCLQSWRLATDRAGADLSRRAVRDGSLGDAPEAQDAVADDGGIEARIARLAQEADLSPRETEVFGYVGRGHSAVYVAKTLLVSESTVYTHVRNIYRKLGVSSRDGLLALLERDAR